MNSDFTMICDDLLCFRFRIRGEEVDEYVEQEKRIDDIADDCRWSFQGEHRAARRLGLGGKGSLIGYCHCCVNDKKENKPVPEDLQVAVVWDDPVTSFSSSAMNSC